NQSTSKTASPKKQATVGNAVESSGTASASVASTAELTEIPRVPPPPKPPSIRPAPVAEAAKPAPAAELAEKADSFQDYETVPQGYEDEDEREQTFYYLALEEKQAPFYFADYASEPLYRLPLEFKAAQIAAAIDSGAAPERLNALRDLLWRLLFEGQFGFAFQLARTLERAHRAERICLPSWLIRVVALGLNIRY